MYTNTRVQIRNEQIKLFMAILALALISFIFLSFIIYSFTVYPEITYQRVIVQEGDTLWGLAAQISEHGNLNSVVNTTMKYNNLSNSYIQPGQVLYVPIRL